LILTEHFPFVISRFSCFIDFNQGGVYRHDAKKRQDRQGSQKARLKEIQFNAVAYSFFETWRDLGVIAVNPSLVEINEK
jgi:hypothetical protein